MSEKLCTLRKHGGGAKLSETVLWSNSNPTSNMDEIVITTSDNISNYKYLKMKLLCATNNIPLGYVYLIYAVDNESETAQDYFGTDIFLDTRYSRMFSIVTDITIQVWHCLTAVNNTKSSSAPHVLVPQEIIGLK